MTATFMCLTFMCHRGLTSCRANGNADEFGRFFNRPPLQREREREGEKEGTRYVSRRGTGHRLVLLVFPPPEALATRASFGKCVTSSGGEERGGEGPRISRRALNHARASRG